MKQQKRIGNGSKRSRQVAAVAMLAACAAGIQALAQNAAAGTQAAGAPVAEAQSSATAVRTFQIPAGSLADAITLFRKDAKLSLVFDVPQASADDFRTRGVKGTMTDAEALRQMLDGTGLTVAFTSPTEVKIGLRHAEQVEVTSTLPDGVAMNEVYAAAGRYAGDDRGDPAVRDRR